MEIPDSDEEEEEISLLPTTPPSNNNNNNNQHDDQDQDPKKQIQPIPSTTTTITHFIERILTQLNHITTRAKNQHHNRHGEQEHEVQGRVHSQAQKKEKKNLLSSLSPSALSHVKPLMLTLHCLFPNELLPALDILDRGLIRRVILQGHGRELSSPATNADESPPPREEKEEKEEEEAIFLVISASNTPTAMTGTAEDEKKGYEVRLQAWNCTCTQFLLSAFPDADADADPILQPGSDANSNDNDNSSERCRDEADSTEPEWGWYRFGGSLTRGLSPLPVCKHLLACMLFVRCPELFGEESQMGSCRRLVTVEELAAWCAGWGDS